MFIANLLAALRERGHEMRIVSRVDARDFWRGRLPARRLIAEAALVRGDMKRFSPDAWLVYAASVQYPDLFGWWQRPRRYVLLGCEGSRTSRVMALPRPWREIFTFAHRQSLKRAHKIVGVRPGAVEDYRRWGVPEERICFLPLGIKTWTRIPCREEARRVLGLPQEAPIVLCVSRLAVRSGKDDRVPSKTEAILDLLRAFAELPANVLLLLVGDGLGRPQLEQEAERLKLAGRVQFAGAVEHGDVSWFYAASDFFAFPEKAEGNRPYQALLEAQACGRPVVTMQTALAQMTVEAGRTGLLARDLNELPAHLLTLAQDRNLCDEMGRAGAAFVARSFSIEARARQIEELLLGSRDVSTGETQQQASPQRGERAEASLIKT
ncbi:MAG TPA: glycosyltransferase family 4 protein [Candidatus Acidoferrales bacterium]|nr:glycosyltransferase family 4 protein [Candidatus Acidoferrales bacterium]